MSKVISPTCIVPSIAGRLGNNMFMIAHAYARALEQNRQMVVPRYQVGHMADFLDNIFRKLDVYIDMPDDLQHTGATIYGGYFQSEKHFRNHSEAVKQLFSPTREFIEQTQAKYPFLKNNAVVCISVRRGDYLIYSDYHPVVSKEYIEAALKHLPPANHYFIFSDDFPWCKENLGHLPNVHYIEAPVHEQMWLMSMCDHFIISNSSFSWWGAYLSRNPNKVVVAPQTWFGPRFVGTWHDMYCDKWIIQPTEYRDGYIYPKS
jgi:hypothetical protein